MSAPRQLVVADLFFGLTAILLILVALLSSGVARIAETALSDPADATLVARDFAAAHDAPVIVATSDGVTLHDGTTMPLDRLAGWDAPRFTAPPLVIVTPDGMEADFLLATPLGRSGLTAVTRLRMTDACRLIVATPSGAVCHR